MSLAVAVGRPLATSPGVPPERVAALRKAFQDTLKDPEFIAEAVKTNSEIRPVPGEELAKHIEKLIGAPQAVKDRMKIVLEPKTSDTQEIKPEKK
jgi:tripartite-type tricarboxylate transporter receptor subunit TctC